MAHPSSNETDTRRDPTPASAPTFGTGASALVDDSGLVMGWSPGMERLLGHPADDVIGHPLGSVMTRPSAPPAATARWDPAPSSQSGTRAPLKAPALREEPATPRDLPEATWLTDLAGPERVQQTVMNDSWSSVLQARHRDGRTVPVIVEAVPLAGPAGTRQWALSTAGFSVAPAAPDGGTILLRTLMERSPIPFALWDTDLRCIWVNDAGSTLSGVCGEDLGRTLDESPGQGLDRATLGPAMRRVLETGVPVVDLEVRRTLVGEGERALSVSVFRLDAQDGSPQGLCTLGIDVSHSIARQRFALLTKAGTSVGSTLDIVTTAQELADVSLHDLADFVIVDLAEWVPLGEIPRVRPGSGVHGEPTCRRAGLASIHEGAPEAVFTPGEVAYYPPSAPMVRTLTTGESYFEPFLDGTGAWLREDTARARSISEAGMHSMMCVPLKARGAILGIAIFLRTDNPMPFTRDDLLLAEDLATRAALSLDNARRYARERNAALTLQRDLLPRHVPGCHGLNITSRYLPTDKHEGVGGDWYDAIPLSGQRSALVVGDVVGHGINAAAAMGRLRTAVHTLAALDLPPHRLLAHLDSVALRLSEETDGKSGRIAIPRLAATCAYAVYDPATEICTLSLAGHPPPAIVAPDGPATFAKAPAGGPVGWGISVYESVDLRLTEGSKIALFTDGLIETRRDDIDIGLARLASALAHRTNSLEEHCEYIIRTMLPGATPEDDVSLLLARTCSPGSARREGGSRGPSAA